MHFVTIFKCVDLNLDPALKAPFTSLNIDILCHLRFFWSISWKPGRMPWGHWVFPRSSVILHVAFSCFVSQSTKCVYFGSWTDLRCLVLFGWMKLGEVMNPNSLFCNALHSGLRSMKLLCVLPRSMESTYLISFWTYYDLSWLELGHLWEAAFLLDIIPLTWVTCP